MVDLAGVQVVEHRGERRPARRPRFVGDALRRFGEPQAADPAVVSVDGADQQTVGATSLETSVDAVLGTSPSSAAASLTEMPGWRPTSRSSSAWDCVSPVRVEPPPDRPPQLPPESPTTSNSLAGEIGAGLHVKHDTSVSELFSNEHPGSSAMRREQ